MDKGNTMILYEFNVKGFPTLICQFSPGEGMDLMTIETQTHAAPEFWVNWNKLARYCELALKLPESHEWEIEPVKIARTDKGVQVTAMIKIKDNPYRMKIDTPFYKEDDKKPTMDSEMYEIFQLVMFECEEFAKGKRAQMELFDENRRKENQADEKQLELNPAKEILLLPSGTDGSFSSDELPFVD